MKIGETITLYAGAQPAHSRAAENDAKEQEKRKTLFAGELNQNNTLQDRIAQRREQARREAMKAVGDAFAGRQKVDEITDESRAHLEELKADQERLKEEAAGVSGRQERLETAFAAGEIGQEEYLAQKASLSEEETVYRDKMAENQGKIMGENASIRGTKRELLKDKSMVKAWNQADSIMEAAGDEIMGMVVEEAKDHLDEEAEERREQAQEIKEEREEQEEILEKRQERKDRLEELAESVPVEEMVSMDRLQDEVEQEVQEILNKLKLLPEDIKGTSVDQLL
ncbi:MAG: hypothetical protein OSJ69_00645 [Acetatifactor sp.]|nr:hypothetical protein [Acetatifactor sp.]